jgi:hypothetical protein
MTALKMKRCRQAEEQRLAAHGLAPVERFVFLPARARRVRVLEVGAESGPRLQCCPYSPQARGLLRVAFRR